MLRGFCISKSLLLIFRDIMHMATCTVRYSHISTVLLEHEQAILQGFAWKQRSSQVTILLAIAMVLIFSAPGAAEKNTDALALLEFKSSADSAGQFKDWVGNDACSPEMWSGIKCTNGRVTNLVVENMQLMGPIDSLASLSELRLLSVKGNRLNGTIPDFANWGNLKLLYLGENQFSGSIPESIGILSRLSRFSVENNQLSGDIPVSVTNLNRILTLRLENNQLTGTLPNLSISSLSDFNVTGNKLTGLIPGSLSSRFGESSFAGNAGLCGAPLTPCATSKPPATLEPPTSSTMTPTPSSSPAPMSVPTAGGRKKRSSLSTGEIIAIVVGDVAGLLLITLCFLLFYWKRYSKRDEDKPSKGREGEKGEISASMYSTQLPDSERSKLVFFEGSKQTFELEDLLRASAEMLGKGSFGTAYKAVLEDGSVVAVKRLKDVSTNGKKEFEQQMELIGKLKHANVVPLRAYYYAKGEKLLVYDYQLNGSLYSLLHGNRGPGRTPLDWVTRLRIALGASRGLAYLHQECGSQKIPHGNIKSSNVLLDKNYNACISDYGLALLMTSSAATTRMAGYRAPEHADTKRISQRADVYSFGVVLLELLTGKAPVPAYTNAASEEGIDLPRWVHSVVREEWTAEVFDIELMRYRNIEEEMVALLQVAMVCVSPAPEQRPKMGQVVKMIEDIRPDHSTPDEEGADSFSQSPLSESS